ncbi:MAG: hypothetical protein IAE64_05505 [Flavobacteriales bacterium]|nr:hypothetical protein [Flavobacteriales bacterium]
MQKNVLVIAYHFPPGGGPGVQRVLKHITYLRKFGWNPVVLTVENGDFPARDESLLHRIPADVPVVRIPIREPYVLYKKFMGSKGAPVDVNVNMDSAQRRGWKSWLAHVIRSTFFIPDARVFWWRPAARAALHIVKKHNINVLYSSSPPYTCSLIANSVHKKTGLPWVAGFRDPWTGFLTTPERWFLPAAVDKAMERAVFRNASAVECAWTGIIDDAIAKMPDLNRDKFFHVPNGFDSSDFPPVSYVPNDVFTITYTGSLYGQRTPAALLSALETLHRRGELSPDRIRLRIVGRFGANVEAMLRESVFWPSVELVSYVPHHESIAYLIRSEINLLIVDSTKESAQIVPGKVYEYIGVHRPVLAIAPSGSAIENLIAETRAGISVDPENIDGLAEFVKQSLYNWQNGIPIALPSTDVISKYERKNAALALAEILNKVTGL